jgi:hypothetical protein
MVHLTPEQKEVWGYIVMWTWTITMVIAGLIDTYLLVSDRRTITDWVRAHPYLGIPIVMYLQLGVLFLIVHFWGAK